MHDSFGFVFLSVNSSHSQSSPSLWNTLQRELDVGLRDAVLSRDVRLLWRAQGKLPIPDDEKLLDYMNSHRDHRARIIQLMIDAGLGIDGVDLRVLLDDINKNP